MMKGKERKQKSMHCFIRKSPTPSCYRLSAILKVKNLKCILGFKPNLPSQNASTPEFPDFKLNSIALFEF